MVKDKLAQGITKALNEAKEAGELRFDKLPEITLEPPKNKAFGDFTTNVAMVLASETGLNPREVAQLIAGRIGDLDGLVEKVEVAGAGYINFYLSPEWLYDVLRRISSEGDSYGKVDIGHGEKVQVEYVSANPNGPITVAHARGGTIGDVIANLLEALGYDVTRESYINDAPTSTQMQNFGKSVHARYMQVLGYDWPMPEDGYHGAYVVDIARNLVQNYGDKFLSLPEDERIKVLTDLAEQEMLKIQKADLERFGIKFDVWFSERTLHESNKVMKAVEKLLENGYAYKKAGAIWLKSTAFGDDKDRTLVRSNGQPTYIASDAAYHADKFERGFQRIIDVWGPDHHGYVTRTKAAIAALGYDPEKVEIIIYQAVRLFSGGEMVMMSKRAGDVVLLAELLDDVGKDAARFFFLMRSADSTLDFDLKLAKEQSAENPVYYVQYAHARIMSILRLANENNIQVPSANEANLSLLTHESEIDLIKKLAEFPDLVLQAGQLREPHRLTRYAQDLASIFHGFYTDCRVVGDDKDLTGARLVLVDATRVVLASVLRLIGVSAPERM
ncbi:MAG: arginine--tRNA ligase [Armatimonadota bacterium]|nr:arginine--tRNA ligase [Armatimonadota bacterium]